MKQSIQELRERYEGIQDRLTDREIQILDIMRYVSNSQADWDRQIVLSNLRKKRGAHYPLSVHVTNLKIKNSNSIPNLEVREINNLTRINHKMNRK